MRSAQGLWQTVRVKDPRALTSHGQVGASCKGSIRCPVQTWAEAVLSVLTTTLRLEETSKRRVLTSRMRLRASSSWMRGYEMTSLHTALMAASSRQPRGRRPSATLVKISK